MTSKILGIALFSSILLSAHAQIDQWTEVRFGNLQCDFPKGYKSINFTGASGVYYEGKDIYLTVTNQPDTSRMKGNLDRDYTRDFMQVVLDVSRKLNGRVREFRDTVIGNMPGYISRMEISIKDGRKSYYELIQVLQQDTMRSFSSQYFLGDVAAVQATQRFFSSIHVSTRPSGGGGPRKLGIWTGLAIVTLAGAVFAQKWINVKRSSHVKPGSKKPGKNKK